MSFAAFGFKMLDKLGTNLSDTYGTGDTLREKQRKEQEHDYLTRERQGIIARTEGAKAAGLHPLVGLGFQAGPGSVQTIGSDPGAQYQDPPPPDVREEVKSDPNIDRYNAARARLAEAQATQAERDLEASQRRLATQPGQPVPLLDTHPSNKKNPNVKVVPNEIPAGKLGMEAGTHPGAARVEVLPGRYLNVPSGKLKQAAEDNELLGSVLMGLLNRQALSTYFTQDIPAAMGFTGPRIKLSPRPEYVPKYAPRFQKRNRPGSTGSW